jgi:hypothetical protein
MMVRFMVQRYKVFNDIETFCQYFYHDSSITYKLHFEF